MPEGDASSNQIDLAREPDFRLGALAVSPATREVRRGELRESLEPRVMQVLVALHEAAGKVLSRDALIEKCWEGRVVGDDAINRAIGRLRRLAEADSGASFTIETIPRVGYRLLAEGIVPASLADAPVAKSSRRLALAGLGAGAALAAGGLAWWRFATPPAPALPPEIAGMMETGLSGLRDHTPEGMAQAIASFARVVQAVPDYADGWGAMALACAFQSHMVASTRESLLLRARAAIAKTEALDPTNAYIFAAKAWLPPNLGTWRERELLYQAGLKLHPDNAPLLAGSALVHAHVGRTQEAADLIVRAVANAHPLGPDAGWLHIMMLWAAGRIQEADAAADLAFGLYPRQIYVWFWRLYSYLYTGRSDEVLAMIANKDGRPPGVDSFQFDSIATVAVALKTRAAADIARATDVHMALAHKGIGLAINAMGYMGAMGQVDAAFTLADAIYFGRGFSPERVRFSEEQAAYLAPQDVSTLALFSPATIVMRRDKRFLPLVTELGLVKYWRESGSKPDDAKLFL